MKMELFYLFCVVVVDTEWLLARRSIFCGGFNMLCFAVSLKMGEATKTRRRT